MNQVSSEGHRTSDTQIKNADAHLFGSRGQAIFVTQPIRAVTSTLSCADGHNTRDIHIAIAARATQVDAIRENYHQFKDLQRAEIRLTLQIKALCRRACDGDAKAADAVYREVEALFDDEGNGIEGAGHEAQIVTQVALPLMTARAGVHLASLTPKKAAEKLAKRLDHCKEFVEATIGFGYGGLAMIVGEAGDIGNYANPGKLWKRMGMAPVKGQCCATWRARGGLSAAEWGAAGYSPRRRSVMYQITDSMLKNKACPFYAVYIDRKAYLVAREEAKGKQVLPAKKITKQNSEASISLGHIDNMARHYAAKRLLRELWKCWR